MTDQERHELNRWLWLNVFGWVDFREEEYPNRAGYALGSDEGEKYLEADMPDYTNELNAIHVLKKCHEICAVIESHHCCRNGGGYYLEDGDEKIKTEIVPTLELAIALFAKKLFTK